jgi:hypothetical protein
MATFHKRNTGVNNITMAGVELLQATGNQAAQVIVEINILPIYLQFHGFSFIDGGIALRLDPSSLANCTVKKLPLSWGERLAGHWQSV